MAAKTRAGPGPDTDQLLQRGLAAAVAWEQAPAGSTGRPAREAAAEQASSALVTLHAALRDGAPLPSAWAR